MDKLLELAERCERATIGRFGSEVLNRAIGEATGVGGKPGRLHGKSFTIWPSYTASLDAAMTLVPEGALFDVGHFGDEKPGIFLSSIMLAQGASRSSEAATPALALCAAALRARATQGSSTE